MPTSPDELWPKLEATGESQVRKKMAVDAYGADRGVVRAWLDKKERDIQESRATSEVQDRQEGLGISRSATSASWAAVAISVLSLLVAVIALIISLRAQRG